MKTIKITSHLIAVATVTFSILPAFADTKTNLPDLSNTDNPLAVCKTINVGTADHSKTQSTTISTMDNGNNFNHWRNPSVRGASVATSTTEKDIQPVIGHDCDGIADSIAKVETNREDNKTYRHVADRKAEVELIKSLMSW